jgi:hypothetical protein
MNKKTAILSGILVMLAVVASIGVIASQGGMIKKGVNATPEDRNEYIMSDEELKQLETELKATEGQAPEATEMDEAEETPEAMPAAK